MTTGLLGSPTTTTTAYIGNIEEVATTGGGSPSTTTTSYYYAGPLRIAEAVNGTVSYLGEDLLGSATVALTAGGLPQGAQLSAPYGTMRYSDGSLPGSFGFAGQRSGGADAALTGLNYDVARYYDPTAGQFVSADSVLLGGGAGAGVLGLSRYAYVEGNPETHMDADGHCWPFCTAILGVVIGAVISAATDVATGQSIDWGQVGKDAAVGAVSGAISGVVGPERDPWPAPRWMQVPPWRARWSATRSMANR